MAGSVYDTATPHFTARVTVDKTTPADLDEYSNAKRERHTSRTVELTVRADSYEDLVKKLATILPNA